MKKLLLMLVAAICLPCLCSCFEEKTESKKELSPLIDGEDKYTVEIEVDCIGNLFFSKYDVDIYIDGYKLFKLDHGANEFYTVYLSEGNHTIKFTENYNSSVDGSARFVVDKDMSLDFTISCERENIRVDMEDKTPFAPDPSFDTTPADPDDSQLCDVNVTFSCTENLFFSRYDIDIYLDGRELLRLKHGSEKTQTLSLEKGSHIFKFSKAGYSSPNGNVQINISSDMSISIELYCTMDYIDVDHSVEIP